MTSEYVDKIFNTSKKTIGNITDKKLDLGLVIQWGSIIMQAVEKYPELSGADKKDLVIIVLKRLVEEFDIGESEGEIIDILIDNAMPIVIDLVVSASKGELGLNKISMKIKKFFKKICKCC